MKRYSIYDLKVVKVSLGDSTRYLICKYNEFTDMYIEILTNEKLKIKDKECIEPLSNYYSILSQCNYKTGRPLMLDKKSILKKYIDINSDLNLVQEEQEKKVSKDEKISAPSGLPISVAAVMAEYDRKAQSYGKEVPIEDNSKKEMKFSTFSNNDELNCYNKRTSIEKKVGDQRSIVDYINFYPVGNDKEEMETLREKLDIITYSIKQSAFAYLFVISDDAKIRNYFIDNISNLENVSVIDDSKTESDVLLMDTLKEKNVLLLNPDIKAEELKNLNNKVDSYNSLYYRLVFKREFLWNNRKTIIVVADEKTITPLLQENQSLASASSFHFVDDYIKEKGTTKKLTK